MKGIVNTAGLFIKHNSSTILTCVGALGVVATAVTAAKATPKAVTLLQKAEEEKEDKLTGLEKVRVAGPAYIPSIIMGASTIACIFGANILNKRHQAAITSAYALLDTSYKEYRNKVKEIFTEEGDRRVVEGIMEDHYNEEDILEANDGKQLYFDFYSLQFFRSTEEEVARVEKYMNNQLESRGYVLLGEFYEALGMPNWDIDWTLGWSKSAGHIYGYDHIEFDHYSSTMDNGKSCCAVRFLSEPTDDFMS